MINLFPLALERAFSSWWAGWILGFSILLMFTGIFYALEGERARIKDQAAVSRAQLVKARDLWLSECKKPLDECAAAWDDSDTLRSLYRARIPLDEIQPNGYISRD